MSDRRFSESETREGFERAAAVSRPGPASREAAPTPGRIDPAALDLAGPEVDDVRAGERAR